MEGVIPAGARRGVVVVAHPDDETLWCGGLIARGDIEWLVICCTKPRHDPERLIDKFPKACTQLGANYIALGAPEMEPLPFEGIPDLGLFDIVLTHGAAGEYGHRQHIELHNFIVDRYPLKSRFFGYRKSGKGRFDLPLDETMKAKKLAALKCYDHRAPTDRGLTKWEALLQVFEKKFDLWHETYD